MSGSIIAYLLALRARLPRGALLIAGAMATVAIICWVGGWRTPYDFGNGLIWAGTIVIAAGAFGVAGSRDALGDPNYLMLRSGETRRRGYDPIAADRHYADARVVSFVQAVVVGASLIACGEAVKRLFP